MKTRVSTYAFAINDGHLLMTQLAPYCYRAGHWTLPGGGMDHGEQPLESLHREVYEETGLKAHAPELIHASSYSESDRGLFMAVQLLYKATIQGEPKVLEEGGSTAAVRWVPFSELPTLPIVPFVKEFLTAQGLLPVPEGAQ